MARPAGGFEHVDAAYALLQQARSADELRQAQAVLLPLVLGLSIEQTALAIGRSTSVTCSMRTRFGRVASGLENAPRAKHELRNRALASLEREKQLIDAVVGRARSASVAIIPRLKATLEADLGQAVALSSVYRVLQRHGWRREFSVPASREGALPAQAERRKKPPAHWVRA